MHPQLAELRSRLTEVSDLQMAAGVLRWDQTTYMPPGGAAARGRQLALLARLVHEKQTDPAIGKVLDDLRPYEESLPYAHDDAAMLRAARRFYEKAVKVPAAFTAELAGHRAATLHGWLKENIYQHGRKFTAAEITQRVAGSPLTIEPYIAYLRRTFGELYTQ